MDNRRITKAIFPVAGLGTRFLPATKSIPKEILTLVDRPLIDYAVQEAREAGIEQFIFVTARGKSALSDYFDDAPILEEALAKGGKIKQLESLRQTNIESGKIAYVRQSQPLGLGHAIWCARSMISRDEAFAVLLPDEIFLTESKGVLSQMIDEYSDQDGCMIATTTVSDAVISSYGVIEHEPHAIDTCNAKRIVRSMVEKPKVLEAPSSNIVVGRYILRDSVMDYLSLKKEGSGGEIQLTDAIAQEVTAGRRVTSFGYDGVRYDCGSKIGFLEATIDMSLRRSDLREAVFTLLNERFSAKHAAE